MAKMAVNTVVNKLVERSNTNTRRLRDLEQQINIMSSRVESLQDSRTEDLDELNDDIDELFLKLDEQDAKIAGIEKSIKEIVVQMKKMVTETRIKEIEALIDAYNPLKSNFVTKQEVQRMLRK